MKRATLVLSCIAAWAPALCARAIVITTLDSAGQVGSGNAVAYGPNGLALVSYVDLTNGDLKVAACQDTACTSALLTTVDAAAVGGGTGIAFGGDGRAVISYLGASSVKVAHCEDATCATATLSTIETVQGLQPDTAIAIGADGLPVVAYGQGLALKLAHCTTATCSASSVTAFPNRTGAHPTLALGGDGLMLVACENGLFTAASIHIGHCTDAACSAATFVTLAGSSIPGLQQGHNNPSLAIRSDGLGEVAYEFSYGPILKTVITTRVVRCTSATCSAVVDAPGGILARLRDPAFALRPGDVPLLAHVNGSLSPSLIEVTRCPDAACSPAPLTPVPDTSEGKQPSVALDPSGVGLVALDAGGDLKVVHLSGGDLTIADTIAREGDGGVWEMQIEVRLSQTGSAEVSYGTGSGTATPGTDYTQVSGTLSFGPGVLSQFVRVPIVGDPIVEPNETFYASLSNPQGALILDSQAAVTLENDDAVVSGVEGELAHGSRVRGDLASAGTGDVDLFRLFQVPYSSYEVAVEEASADVSPIQLERLAAIGGGVLQTATPAGTGTSVAMRWQHGTAAGLAGELVRVRSGDCQTDCDAEDLYSLRTTETTLRAARFNQTGAQTTVLLVQNASDEAVDLTVYFWSATGALLDTYVAPSPLGAKALLTLAIAQRPALAGWSGSLTITHTGRPGALVGKAVALEPTTGLSLDTPLEPRP